MTTLWDEMRRMQQEMDRLFSAFFGYEPFDSGRKLLPGNAGSTDVVSSNYRQPLADIWETDKEVVATVELPGVDKNDIQVNVTDDGMEIKVEKKEETKEEDKKKGMYRYERKYSGFYRFIPLPDGVDTDNIKASYKNGVLEVRVPKTEEKKKSKKVKVE